MCSIVDCIASSSSTGTIANIVSSWPRYCWLLIVILNTFTSRSWSNEWWISAGCKAGCSCSLEISFDVLVDLVLQDTANRFLNDRLYCWSNSHVPQEDTHCLDQDLECGMSFAHWCSKVKGEECLKSISDNDAPNAVAVFLFSSSNALVLNLLHLPLLSYHNTSSIKVDYDVITRPWQCVCNVYYTLTMTNLQWNKKILKEGERRLVHCMLHAETCVQIF